MKARLLDLFCGEGGAGVGYQRAGFDVHGVDTDRARLARYPHQWTAADALDYAIAFGAEFDAIHASPPCQGYSRGTVALPDRVARYDRMIDATRAVLESVGRPYVIENVEDAKRELRTPALLCGRMFGLAATDDDGTPLVMDRHRLFETNWLLLPPEHLPHDRSLQVAGSYGGARRDKREAREIRRGGYVPSIDVQRALLGTPWMSQKGLPAFHPARLHGVHRPPVARPSARACRMTYLLRLRRITSETVSPRSAATRCAASHKASSTRTLRAVVAPTSAPHSRVLAGEAVTPRLQDGRVHAAAAHGAHGSGAHCGVLPAQHRVEGCLVVGDGRLPLSRHTHSVPTPVPTMSRGAA